MFKNRLEKVTKVEKEQKAREGKHQWQKSQPDVVQHLLPSVTEVYGSNEDSD